MQHKAYKKIRALTLHGSNEPNPENDGILKGTVYIQEKIDGANLSIWKDENLQLFVGSRTTTVGTGKIKNGFRGAVEYVNETIGDEVNNLIDDVNAVYKTEDIRLYGEWLVKHTIGNYNLDAYNHFYLFDIEVNGENLDPLEVESFANQHGIKCPRIFWVGGGTKNYVMKQIDKYMGKSNIGPDAEGLVIKNPSFINKFGDTCHAKVVGEKFKESNALTFGNHQKGDGEMKLGLQFCAEGRVKKIINKIEQQEDRDIKLGDINRIIGMVQHDIITEEIWVIQKEGVFDFKRFKHIIGKRTALIAMNIIKGETQSVAFED